MDKRIRIFAILLFVSLFLPVSPAAAEIKLWAINDSVHIDPETGKAIEDDKEKLPGTIEGDYNSKNMIWTGKEQTVRISGGKNEVVGFQVVIEGKANKVNVEMSQLTGAAGKTIEKKQIKLFREWYIWIKKQPPSRACMVPLKEGWYPDVAIPLSEPKYGNGFSIPSKDFHDLKSTKFPDQKNQAIWVDLHIPKDAVPGDYTGSITVTADGAAKVLNVALKVWDFTIPSEINMFADLLNYGDTVKEPSRTMMNNYFKLAQEHRTMLGDTKGKTDYNGTDYNWKEFDEKYGPLFDGSLFTDGPTAGIPVSNWIFPIAYSNVRIDKEPSWGIKKNWPVDDVPLSPTKYGIVFNSSFKKSLGTAMKKWEDHFISKGWTKTRHWIYQTCLDEPGFHKSGKELEAGKEQALAIYETAKLIKDNNLKLLVYRFDVGGGIEGNKLDLDGNGKVEGPLDVANYFAPVVKLFNIAGLRLNLPVMEPVMKKYGNELTFYNGWNPRVGPKTINGEFLGFRTWGVSAWRSGLNGWSDWEFRLNDKRKKVFYEPNLPEEPGVNLYFYRGEDLGLKDTLFASLRLKSMRRGAQDYEMLRLLTLKDGNDKRAQLIASSVCGVGFKKEVKIDFKEYQDDELGVVKPFSKVDSKSHWSHNSEEWEKFHSVLGEALSK